MKTKNKKGFTIVELVIVIAVIAILAAVMIPTFAGMISKANESAAYQEAKNIHTAYLVTVNAQPNYEEGVDYYVAVSTDDDDDTYEYYFQIVDGQLSVTAAENAPTTATLIVADGESATTVTIPAAEPENP